MGIKIQVLPTDTVAQWVEHRRDMPKDLGSNPSECHIFLAFFLCYPGEALEGPISTGVGKKLNNVDSNINFIFTMLYIYIISRRSITPQHIKYFSKSLDVVQSLYFGSKLPSSGTYKYLYVICTFLTKAACFRNIEIVLHPTTLSYVYIDTY